VIAIGSVGPACCDSNLPQGHRLSPRSNNHVRWLIRRGLQPKVYLGSVQTTDTGKFVLIAVRHEAQYWTPHTIAREVYANGLLAPQSEADLSAFRDEILRGLVGRRAEKFWANDSITPARAAAIRSACQGLHQLTLETFQEAIEKGAPDNSSDSPATHPRSTS
jgi:hypothetical protein